MKIFEDEDQLKKLEEAILHSDLEDSNKLLVIRCIENTRTSNNEDNQIHLKESEICSVRGLS